MDLVTCIHLCSSGAKPKQGLKIILHLVWNRTFAHRQEETIRLPGIIGKLMEEVEKQPDFCQRFKEFVRLHRASGTPDVSAVVEYWMPGRRVQTYAYLMNRVNLNVDNHM